ncbi:MAG: hypothetical protein ACXABI_15120 [Candidatus Hodarchaeales archaeon]|jgi:hypothetical protein
MNRREELDSQTGLAESKSEVEVTEEWVVFQVASLEVQELIGTQEMQEDEFRDILADFSSSEALEGIDQSQSPLNLSTDTQVLEQAQTTLLLELKSAVINEPQTGLEHFYSLDNDIKQDFQELKELEKLQDDPSGILIQTTLDSFFADIKESTAETEQISLEIKTNLSHLDSPGSTSQDLQVEIPPHLDEQSSTPLQNFLKSIPDSSQILPASTNATMFSPVSKPIIDLDIQFNIEKGNITFTPGPAQFTPPPYNFDEDMANIEAWNAQSDKAEPHVSDSLVKTFEDGQRIQQQASLEFIQSTASSVTTSIALDIPTNRGVVKEQIEALDRIISYPFTVHPENSSSRLVTFTTRTPEAMVNLYIDKQQLGVFTSKTDVTKYSKRNFGRLQKGGPWGSLNDIIKPQKILKEIEEESTKQIDWVTVNRRKGWTETGQQRLNIEIKMDKLTPYYTQLQLHAHQLAQDTEATRVYLSNMKTEKVEAATEFWLKQGYLPRLAYPTTQHLTHQRTWPVTHARVDGQTVFCELIKTDFLDNNRLGQQVKSWRETYQTQVESSTIPLEVNGNKLTIENIIPPEILANPKLLTEEYRRNDINSLHENMGGTELFKMVLDREKQVLADYLNLDRKVLKTCNISYDWGRVRDRTEAIAVDKQGREFRWTFGPDIVVEDPTGNPITVIQLKGLSQRSHELRATSSVFQMVELMKYHVEHQVPVAMINLKRSKEGLEYEWMVLGRNNEESPQWMKELVDPEKGLDPILPRNARSREFVQNVYNDFISNNGEINFVKAKDKLQNLVTESQRNFQKYLRVYKAESKYLDASDYWENIVNRIIEEKEQYSKSIIFNQFYQKWKSIIVADYKNRLQGLKLGNT